MICRAIQKESFVTYWSKDPSKCQITLGAIYAEIQIIKRSAFFHNCKFLFVSAEEFSSSLDDLVHQPHNSVSLWMLVGTVSLLCVSLFSVLQQFFFFRGVSVLFSELCSLLCNRKQERVGQMQWLNRKWSYTDLCWMKQWNSYLPAHNRSFFFSFTAPIAALNTFLNCNFLCKIWVPICSA